MKILGVIVVAGLAGVLTGPVALADPAAPVRDQDRASPYMRVFGVTQPPYGFVQFCERVPGECRLGPQEEQRFSAGPQRLTELDAVNRAVNREIEPATDLEIYGQTEYWTIPASRGDCEDYALLKRQRLMARGWPASALLITVVRDEKGEGHALLLARTVQGDFILDNKVDEVKVWTRTPYDFVMRQSYLNPRIWMSLDPKEANSTLPLAGVRSAR
ncbi:MAG TPA: transglutaminase-like cysteine peptidase [Hyphomicrobiaceae bacterium]|nr:transglutaminase-like cysteine peptidase [Hyphomicrobiaceae bacterium]